MHPDSPSTTPSGTNAGTIVLDRPPPGLARGKYTVPAWAVALLGASIVSLSAVFAFRRFFRRPRQ